MFFRFFLFFFCIVYSFFVNSNIIQSNKNMVLIPKNIYYPLFKIDGDNFFPVEVDSFYIDKYPVTNSNFYSFLLENSNWNKKNIKSIFADKNYLSHWEDNNFEDISDNPVTNISWFAANAYCVFYGKRLPTIDEWESIGSSGELTPIGKDDSTYLSSILNWYTGKKSNFIIRIQDMKKNYWGVYGMNGIIWEWVDDFNSVIMLNADAEGGELEEILFCGAAATNSLDPADYAAFMRFAFRNSLQANYTMSSLGFRCAKNVE